VPIYRWYWLSLTLALLIFADIISTVYLVSLPGIEELNTLPALMMEVSVLLWPMCAMACLVLVLVGTAGLYRVSSITHYIPAWWSLMPCIIIEGVAAGSNYLLLLSR